MNSVKVISAHKLFAVVIRQMSTALTTKKSKNEKTKKSRAQTKSVRACLSFLFSICIYIGTNNNEAKSNVAAVLLYFIISCRTVHLRFR